MPFRPFHSEPAQHRAVILPPDLPADIRQKLLTRLAAAVKQQAALAAREDAVLRLRGDVIDAGHLLLIPHEPVCPLLPAEAAAGDRPDIRTLQWLTWVGLRALRAAASDNICHGGLTLGALYRDEVGRPRIGDFGIAPAFEFAFGMEARRGIHCESGMTVDEHGRSLSGAWAMRPDEEREAGWIAPFFGHELTEGKVRLNPKADQFALGTLLFVLATGAHPYGAALSDPNLMFYFHVDPYNVADERAEWKPVLERLEKGLTQAADRPILSWWEVLQRLLASDPGERYASLADAEKQLGESIPADWPQAWEALGEAMQRLEAGDAEAALELASPWTTSEALPDLWREPLSAWHARLASQKETIVRQRQAERTLREAQEALNSVDLPRARALARSLVDAPDVAEATRQAAQDVLDRCDEQERFVLSEAAPLAQAYLQAAREALAAGDVQPAREILSGVLADPATPPPLASQAREMLAEIELSQRREEQQRADLATALQEMEDGHYDAASQRVESLLADATLPAALSEQARGLKSQIDQFRRQRGEYAAALEEARTAWENSDLDTLRARLDEVDPAFPDPQIADVREDLAQRAAALQQALRIREAALKRQQAGDHAGVIEALRKAARDGLPQRLLDAFSELRRAAEEAERVRRQAEIDAARTQLDAASAALERGDVDACERAVAALPDAVRELEAALADRADALLAQCEAFRRASEALAGVHRDIAARRFDSARKQLVALPAAKLPAALRPRHAEVERELDAAYLAHLEAQQQELERRVAAAEKALADGHMDETERLAREARQSPYLNDALAARLKRVDAELRQLRGVQSVLEQVERELARGVEADAAAAFAALDGLPRELPRWLTNRADLARTKAQQIRKAQERAQRDAAIAALDAADASIASGDADEAEAALARSRDASQRDPLLRERHDALTSSANLLRPWLRRLDDVERKLRDADLLGAQRDAGAMLRDREIPAGARKRLEKLDAALKAQIAEQRAALDEALARLRTQLEQRGRRAKLVVPGAAEIQQHALATEQQKAAAQELAARYEALPPPKLPVVPLVVAGALAIAGIGVGAYLMRPPATTVDPNRGRDSDANSLVAVDPNLGGTTAQPDDATRLAAAAAALRQRAAQALGAEPAAIQVSFDPADRLPSSLVVRNGERTVRRPDVDREALSNLSLTEQELSALRPPPPPTDAEVIAAAVARLRGELAAAAGSGAARARLSVAPTDRFPTTLTLEQDDRRVTVEFTARSQLDAYRVTPETYARLLPDPNQDNTDEPNTPAAEANPAAYAAELQRLLVAEATSLPGAAQVAALREVAVSAGEPHENRFAVNATWAGRTLPAIESVQFDPAANAYAPAASDAAARLAPLMRAIASLAQGNLRIVSRPGYEKALELVDPLATAAVELDERGVATAAGRARFRAAQQESLQVSGELKAGVLTLDETSLRAFDERLGAIRARAAEALPTALAAALNVPALPAGLSAEPTIAENVAQVVVRAAGKELVKLPAAWDAAALQFRLDGPAAATSLLDALRADLNSAGKSPALRSTWAAFVEAMSLPTDQPGRGYLARLVVQRIEPHGQSLAELLDPQARVTLAAPDGAAEDAISVAAKLRREGDGWAWDAASADTAAAGLRAELGRLAADAAFRERRAAAAIAALQREGAQEIKSPQRSAEALTVAATVDGKASNVTWTWDASQFEWTGRKVEVTSGEQPRTDVPAPLENRLAALVGEATAARPDFGDQVAGALMDIAADKATRYKVEGKYGPAAALAQGDAMSRFVRASTAVQRAAAPAPRTDAFPTVFVELWAGPGNVYAIGWRAITDGQDQITRVEGLRVRAVMPTAELTRFASADQLRQTLASDRRLGDAILGESLGAQPSASGGGSFGVVVAPDSAFWVIPWDQVAFTARPIQGVDLRGAPDAGDVGRMHDLLMGAQVRAGAGGFVYRRAGLWCVPALFGEAAGGAANVEFALGQVIPGNNREVTSIYRKRGDALFMLVDLREGRDAKWANWLQTVKQSELGYSFWNRQWEPPAARNAAWEPTPNINFAILQQP